MKHFLNIIISLMILVSSPCYGYDLSLSTDKFSKEIRELKDLDNFGRAGVIISRIETPLASGGAVGVTIAPNLFSVGQFLNLKAFIPIVISGAALGSAKTSEASGACLLYNAGLDTQLTIWHFHIGAAAVQQKVYKNRLGFQQSPPPLEGTLIKTYVGFSF